MKHQRGVALSGLIFWGIVVALVAMLGMKVVPSVIEYYKTLKDAKATIASLPPSATVADVRKTFDNYANIDSLDLQASDLDISKDGGQIVISFAYDKKIPLFANVSLLIEYSGSTSGTNKE